MEQLLRSFVVDGLWAVVHHSIITHEFKIRLKAKKCSNNYYGKCLHVRFICNWISLNLIFKSLASARRGRCYPHLEFSYCIVLIVSNFVLHCAEVHRMFNDHWVTRRDRIRYWKCKESMGIFPGKKSHHRQCYLLLLTFQTDSIQKLVSVFLSMTRQKTKNL